MRNIVKITSFLVVIVQLVFVLPSANCKTSDKSFGRHIYSELENVEFYTVDQVRNSLVDYNVTGKTDEILEDVLMHTSMGITVPKIDINKIVADELCIEKYNSYLTDEEKEKAINEHDSLKNIDISEWTYGMYVYYTETKKQEKYIYQLTEKYIAHLSDRQILLDDISFIIDQGYSLCDIPHLSDSLLRCLIEEGYRRMAFNILYDLDVEIIVQDDVEITFIRKFLALSVLENVGSSAAIAQYDNISLAIFKTSESYVVFKPYRIFRPPLKLSLPLLI